MGALAITLALFAGGTALTAASLAVADIATGFSHTTILDRIITPAVLTAVAGCLALFVLVGLFALGVRF